jgi:hypothetical protein
VEWYDPQNKKVKHCQTAKFDEFRTHIGNDKPMPGALSIGGTPLKATNLPTVSINTADHPFFTEPPRHFLIPIPPKGRALGIEIGDCDYYILPFISKSKAGFPFHKHLPVTHRHNVWILSINNSEPSDAANAIHILQTLQLKGKISTIDVYLAPKSSDTTRTCLEENRALFKQIQFSRQDNIVSSNSAAFISFTCNTPPAPQVMKLIFSPIRPKAPAHMGEFNTTTHKAEWKESMFENYEKMDTSGTLTAPIL